MASLSVFMDARRKKTVSDAELPLYIPVSYTHLDVYKRQSLNDSVLHILVPSTPTALAASSTVALETSNSKILSSMPNCLKYSLTVLIATGYLPSFILFIDMRVNYTISRERAKPFLTRILKGFRQKRDLWRTN